ncbi:MAG: glycoside hydrolase family 43 protein [Prevotella sp.]|jgi:beta-xylosidase|nr:glycoside hydrolase family 43 protein [Prevotella sp.]
MKKLYLIIIAIGLIGLQACVSKKEETKRMSGNPAFEGWYADPEGMIFDDKYWIFPTYSAAYEEQVFLDAFSSPNLVDWTKHERIIDTSEVKWIWRAMWAPAVIKKDKKYYLFFGGNDIQNNNDYGGIGVGVADKPEGPYKDHLGKPLIDKIYNGAQPIDQFVFKDKDGSHYIYYGGWRHCNVAKLNDDFTGFIPFEDGTTFKEVTPKNYVEGPFMFIKDGKYYFMWSEGGWTGPDYKVAYAIADNPLGPFERVSTILERDSIANGAGHHSVIHEPKSDKYYIVYHRRPANETARDWRETCIEEMFFDENGHIKPVVMTKEGVLENPLK